VVFTSTTAPTLTMTFTPTLIRPTRSITETLPSTPTPIFTAASVTVASVSVTPAVDVATISVSVATNCRIGPGKSYEIAGTLLVDEKAEVLGRDPSGDYWYIPNPDPGAEFCWVWGEYATLTGPFLLVPMFTPPPTATATGTPSPDLPFTMKGHGLDSCDGWWVKIEIGNTSTMLFKSVKIEMTDTETNVVRVTSSDGFTIRNGCGNYSHVDEIGPNQSFVVGGPKFDYDPRGNIMRTFVTICTEKELKGICSTKKFGYTP
jgi:hypothetical protein